MRDAIHDHLFRVVSQLGVLKLFNYNYKDIVSLKNKRWNNADKVKSNAVFGNYINTKNHTEQRRVKSSKIKFLVIALGYAIKRADIKIATIFPRELLPLFFSRFHLFRRRYRPSPAKFRSIKMRLPVDLPRHVTRARGIITMHGRQKSGAKKERGREGGREGGKYKQVVR